GRHVLATVANGDGGEFAHYLHAADGGWTQITRFSDEAKHGEFGRDQALYLLSTQKARHGNILRLTLDAPDLAKASVVVPESAAVIESFNPSAHGLYVADLVG